MNIRAATLDDLPAVSALLGITWHATYDGIYGAERVADITSRWHSVEALTRGLAKEQHQFLVAVEDGQVMGTISIGEACGGGVKLDRLYVHPRAQGRGIGRCLLEAGLAAFPRGAAVSLEVEPENTQAIRFYERNGFSVTGRSSDCTGSGDKIAALVMNRPPQGATASSTIDSNTA